MIQNNAERSLLNLRRNSFIIVDPILSGVRASGNLCAVHFRDEAALYDNTFQQYGQIYVMDADGGNKRLLTDSKWEDSMPLYIDKALL